MLGPSRLALREVRAALLEHRDADGFAGVSDELLAVSDLLGTNGALRRSLADAGVSAARKQAVVDQLFGDRLSRPSVELLREVVARRWSSPADLTDAVEELGAEAAFVVAERDGRLDRVEDELFRFGRIAAAEPTLLAAMDDLSVDGPARTAVVEQLLDGKADPTTIALLEHLTRSPRGRRFAAALEHLSTLAAARRDQLVADVRTAAALRPDQEQRLAAALARLYGKDVHLQVSIDPDVLGGIVVRVGDEVIDGSIASRLEQARRRLAS